jgi:hypothetical protein
VLSLLPPLDQGTQPFQVEPIIQRRRFWRFEDLGNPGKSPVVQEEAEGVLPDAAQADVLVAILILTSIPASSRLRTEIRFVATGRTTTVTAMWIWLTADARNAPDLWTAMTAYGAPGRRRVRAMSVWQVLRPIVMMR